MNGNYFFTYHNFRYCHWKWTWQPKFKSWMRLAVFYMALIPLEKA